MSITLSQIEALVRHRLVEESASYWSSPELIDIEIAGVKDLWRDIVDLKAEHYLTINNTDVFLGASSSALSGVPSDVHKVYLIEARDVTINGSNANLVFKPLDYNHPTFQGARTRSAIEPSNDCIYYAITGQGAPVNAPIIYTAPQVSSQVNLSFAYVPTIGSLTSNSPVPIPGEADNAIVAWTVAFALSKEREDRSPDPNWLAIYATEKAHILESLGLRQLQEAEFVDAMFSEYW